MRRLLIAVLLFAGAAGGTAQQPPASLFSYFTGNGEDRLHFLSSPDGLAWSVEGPSVIRKGDAWLVFYDEYTRKKYGALRSTDLKPWTPIDGFAPPPGVRHGTAFEVSAGVAAKFAASK